MKNAINIENTIIVAFLLLEYNIKVDEKKRMWSKALIRQADRLSIKGNNLTDEELSELTLSDIEEIKLKN